MPNDLWIDAKGGIYFSDFIMHGEAPAGGLQVYYISPDHKTVTCATNDLSEPNGVIGTPDGKTLYVADRGVVWSYKIQPDGSLTDKKFFCKENSDGFTIDEKNNLYCTGEKISIYNPEGEKIDEIDLPASNLTFGGRDRNTLFIAARTSVCTLEMAVKGAPTALDLAGGKK
jgi:gluconolactonase